MERGEGVYVWDADGARYLDLFAGFGGGILGHCHPTLVSAAREQADRLWHVGNTFYTEPQIELGERLNRHAFEGQAFFCHSGAEANEAACKLARLRGVASNANKWRILSLRHSFHGRTLAMIAATGNPAVRAGFGPEVPGFEQVEAGNFDDLCKAATDEVCGIILEPIQGEGGVNLYPDGYIQRVRELCNRKQITLIFDEVWTGCGRTGRWFGHQHVRDEAGQVITPDIMTLGKAIGGGLPVGVMFARPEVAALLVPGKHGCTLGGNPICMNVSRTIFDVIEREKLLENASALGEHAIARLRNEASIRQARRRTRKGAVSRNRAERVPEKIVERALERRIIINLTAKTVVRLRRRSTSASPSGMKDWIASSSASPNREVV